MHVLVQFYPWFKFCFPLFLSMVMYVIVQFGFWFNFDFPLFFSMLIHVYDNEYQTKENQN